MKKKKSLLWGIILILCIGGGYGLYLRHQHNLNTPRTLLEMGQEAHWKILDRLWITKHIDDGFAKFSSPILVDSVRVGKDLFVTYKMIRLIDRDTKLPCTATSVLKQKILPEQVNHTYGKILY